MGVILALLSLLIFFFVFIFDLLFLSVFKVKRRRWLSLYSKRAFRKAILIDVFGNYLFPEFWTFCFSKKNMGYTFGILGETISSVLGKKKLDDSLSIIGLSLYYILFLIDFKVWTKGGHCIYYIMTDDEIINFFNKY
jgi:hypothetical protein